MVFFTHLFFFFNDRNGYMIMNCIKNSLTERMFVAVGVWGVVGEGKLDIELIDFPRVITVVMGLAQLLVSTS